MQGTKTYRLPGQIDAHYNLHYRASSSQSASYRTYRTLPFISSSQGNSMKLAMFLTLTLLSLNVLGRPPFKILPGTGFAHHSAIAQWTLHCKHSQQRPDANFSDYRFTSTKQPNNWPT